MVISDMYDPTSEELTRYVPCSPLQGQEPIWPEMVALFKDPTPPKRFSSRPSQTEPSVEVVPGVREEVTGMIVSFHQHVIVFNKYLHEEFRYPGLRIDGLVQERRNSSALAMELRLSCTNPSKYLHDEFKLSLHIEGLVEESRNSSALAMELRLSCTNPWKYLHDEFKLSPHIEGFVQERRNSIDNTLELGLYCTNPSKYLHDEFKLSLHIEGLVQERRNSSALAMELCFSCMH